MKVLLTGATGFIGKEIISILIAKNFDVVVLSRNAESAKKKLPFPFEFYSWNPKAETPPKEAFKDLDAVIHLAGEGIAEKRWSEKQKQEIRDSRVLGTQNLIKGIEQYCEKPLNVFVSASAIGYYPESTAENPSTESSQPGSGFLTDVCLEWEKIAKTVQKTERKVQVRIGVVLGKDGGALQKMLLPFKMGVGGPIGNGKQGLSWIHIHDLARIFVEALENPKIEGAINGTAPHPKSNKEFSKTLGKVLKRPAFMPVPAFMLKLMMGEMSQIVLESKFVVPQKLENLGFDFHFPKLEPALAEICNRHYYEHLKKKF